MKQLLTILELLGATKRSGKYTVKYELGNLRATYNPHTKELSFYNAGCFASFTSLNPSSTKMHWLQFKTALKRV